MTATEAQLKYAREYARAWREKNPELNRQRARDCFRNKYQNNPEFREQNILKSVLYYRTHKCKAATTTAQPNIETTESIAI